MEMQEDSQIPIILGRPFLATACAMIDVKNGRLSLHVGEEKLEFNVSKVMASPSLEDACCRVDFIEKVVLEEMNPLKSPSDPLEACLLGTLDKRVKVQPEMKERFMLTSLIWLHFSPLNTIQGRFLIWR